MSSVRISLALSDIAATLRRGVEVLEQIRDSLVTEPCPDCARAKKIAASAGYGCILPDDHDGPHEIQEGLLS